MQFANLFWGIEEKVCDRNVNPEFSMEIDQTINKWYKDILEGIEKKISPEVPNSDEIDKLCLCVVKTSSQYCSAVIELLDKGYDFPARALMRCLGELSAKFTWSLVGCNNKKNNTPEAIKKRVQRWRKTACSEGIRLLEGSASVMRPEDKEIHEKILNDLKQQREGLGVKNMPDLTEVFNQLEKHYDIYSKIRIAFYSVFNNAVHVDPACMSKIHLAQKRGEDSTRSYCVAIAYHINFLIRSKYDLDIQQITDEFKGLMKTI